jgi:predicted Zn finger-like uncharacterized protein
MKIVCPNCQKEHNIDENKIPENVKTAKCKSCGHRFPLVLELFAATDDPPERAEGTTAIFKIDKPVTPPEFRECPFCCESIPREAKKCKHCGEWLDTKKHPGKDASLDLGENCPDGTCIGHIQSDGHCSVCGLTCSEARHKDRLSTEDFIQVRRALPVNIPPRKASNYAKWFFLSVLVISIIGGIRHSLTMVFSPKDKVQSSELLNSQEKTTPSQSQMSAQNNGGSAIRQGIPYNYTGQSGYLKAGMLVCRSEDQLILARALVSQKDYSTLLPMLEDQRCIISKSGFKVYVMATTPEGNMKIRLDGFTEGAWTIMGTLE